MHALDDACESIKREYTAACSQAARAARTQVTNELNQILRRLRNYKTESEWLSAVLDGASRLVYQVAILELKNDVLTVRGQHNLNVPENYSFPVSSAAAFASAVESRDPIIALRRPNEVSERLSGPDSSERAHIFPIANASRVVAAIFAADQEFLDLNGLELLAGLASAVLERKSNSTLHSQINFESESPGSSVAKSDKRSQVPSEPEPLTKPATRSTGNGRFAEVVQAPPAPAEPVTLPSWADLSEEQRSVHIKAQRFSRITVAEMELARPEACSAGREQGNLYLFLKNDIDKAREKYRQQFMTIPSMVDYLHLELVRAAQGDELKLGADYPGQLD
jgi:hypothetical protein